MRQIISVAEAIKRIAGKKDSGLVIGICKSVNVPGLTCEVLLEDEDLLVEVDLVFPSSATAFVVVPSVDSVVQCLNIRNSDKLAFISCSSADKIMLRGEQYSLVKSEVLEVELAKINAFIAAFKQVLIVPILEAGNSAPSSFQAACNVALSGLPDADFSNIANQEVKHG